MRSLAQLQAAVGDPFPPAFRAMLDHIMRRGARVQSSRSEALRARQRALVQSGTFAGHRAYSHGDDLRRMDWNVYARTGSLFVKLLEEDERRSATIVVDCGAGMLAGGGAGEPPRLATALQLAVVLGGLALQQLDGIHVHAATGMSWFAGRGQSGALMERFEQGLASALPEPPAPDAIVDQLLRHGAVGKVHWISDFADPGQFERALHRLHRAGGRVTGWLPQRSCDFDVDVEGWTMVVDPSTGAQLRVAVDATMRRALRAQLDALRRRQQHLFLALGFPLQRLVLPPSVFDAGQWLEAGWNCRR